MLSNKHWELRVHYVERTTRVHSCQLSLSASCCEVKFSSCSETCTFALGTTVMSQIGAVAPPEASNTVLNHPFSYSSAVKTHYLSPEFCPSCLCYKTSKLQRTVCISHGPHSIYKALGVRKPGLKHQLCRYKLQEPGNWFVILEPPIIFLGKPMAISGTRGCSKDCKRSNETQNAIIKQYEMLCSINMTKINWSTVVARLIKI